MIGCDCSVCASDKPYNRRLRSSLRIEVGARTVLVDTSTDLRQQALRYGMNRLDAVLFTHAHADHIFGLDDVRVYNFRQSSTIPCYGSDATLRALRKTFSYIFADGAQEGGGRPRLELVPVTEAFRLFDEEIVPIPVFHGRLEIFGYRLGTFAYVTDCSFIPEASFEKLAGVEVLVLDALRYDPHPTHFNVEQALEAAARIGARRTILTHLSHDIDPDQPRSALPQGVEFGYDGLFFEID